MNVNGLTGVGATPLNASRNKFNNTEKSSDSAPASRVRLSAVNQQSMLRLISDKALAKIQAWTNLSAEKLGYDLNTLDTSPDATSGRIADFAIGLYGLYKQQNPDLTEEEALNKYEALIKGAVNTGYQEALSVLSGLGMNDKGILDTAKNTIDMTFQKLDKFFAAKRDELQAQSAPATEGEATA